MAALHNHTRRSLAAVVVLGVLAANASALPLPPGGTIPATETIESPSAGTSVDMLIENFSAATFSGEIASTVWQENPGVNPLGGLTFVYGYMNDGTSTDSIGEVTLFSFGDFLVDATVFVQEPTDPFPEEFTRSLDGNVVGIHYGADPVVPGRFGGHIVLRTNATAYTTGTVNFNGGLAPTSVFVPIPEPATLSLLGLAGLTLLRRRD